MVEEYWNHVRLLVRVPRSLDKSAYDPQKGSLQPFDVANSSYPPERDVASDRRGG